MSVKTQADVALPMSRRRVVLLVTSSGDVFGGAERCLLDLVRGMPVRGWRPIVVAPFHGALVDELRAAGVAVRVLELGVLRSRREMRSPMLLWRFLATLPAALRLVYIIRRENVTLVHSNTSVILAAALAAKLARRPHIWHVREILGGPVWQILRRVIPTLSDAVVCISPAVADNLAAPGSPARRRVYVLPDGIDLTHFAVHERQPERVGPALRVGMVARINPWKGHELFLRAAQIVARQLPDAAFTLVGGHIPAYESLYERLKALASEPDLSGRVRFVEHLDRDAVRDFMASLDVLVLPSTQPEPGGLVVLEAMALERAVVATRHGGPVDIIVDGVTGVLVSPHEPTDMAHAIVTLLENDALRQRLGVAARRRVEESFSLERQVDQLVALYIEVAAH